MKKVFDQTVRDLKREVNKNVLKVPPVEQKVLDATSNEPWGPHGTVLADIAHASRNYHEYQMIMNILWKRINDTGKNWRHVYKALTVLEYLVAHGSERVIDEIREHAYQISTLSDFQYIDSGGRDQGSNVRKKSQSIVALVNDKERLIEVRQKAAANKDKYRSASSSGGMYRPGSGGYGDRYDDDRYGYRDDDRYGRNEDSYGREREWGYRDEERYGRNGDSNSRDGDRYEERYGRDGYKDDNQHGQRSRSSDRDRERERSFEDDGQYSSRGGPKTDDSQDGSKKLARKFSEQNIGAPPSYEEAVNESRSPVHSERDGETSAAAPPNTSSTPASTNQISSPPPENTPPTQPLAAPETSVPSANQQVHGFDEFDPRGSVSASSANTINPEMDLLGSLALAIVPTGSDTNTQADSYGNSALSSNDVPPSANAVHQPFGDPFGDAPFKAIPSDTNLAQPQISTSTESLHLEAPKADLGSNFDFGDSLAGLTYPTSNFSTAPTPTGTEFLAPELSTSHQNTDILAGILPSSGPSPDITSQPGYSAQQPTPPGVNAFGNFQPQPGPGALVSAAPQFQNGNYLSHGPTQVTGHGNYLSQAPTVPMTSHVAPQVPTGPNAQFNGGPFAQQGPFTAPNNTNFYPQQGPVGQPGQLHGGKFIPQQTSVSTVTPQTAYQATSAPVSQPSNDVLGSFLPQTGQSHSTGSLATSTKPSNSKFETKSTVWADTLSRGLVNLNISGPKANPMADIGVDFDALNRKEKRMEKPTATPVTSTVTMGKAMGSGSGIGRAGAGALRPPPNHMMGSGMGLGIGMGGGPGPGAGPYGRGMNNQPMGMGMGMNMGMGMGMGMGMNMGMGMGQGPPRQQPPSGFPPGSNPQTGYNPMMGAGYGPQQPYNGYR